MMPCGRTFVARMLVGALPAALVVFAGCSGSDPTKFQPTGGPPSLVEDGGSDGATESACLSQTIAAEPLSLSMLMIVDRSSSMKGASWQAATSAMIAFADGASSVGTELGLSVFPPDAPATDACDASSFMPIVPMGPLPQNSVLIKNALASRSPEGLTPMGIAVRAAHAAMKEHVAVTPKAEGVLLLMTDGIPTGCASSSEEVTFAVRAAVEDSPPIRTFVVGMDGADFGFLDSLAITGKGAPKAFNATSTNDDVQSAIVQALEAVRDTAVGCEFVLPVPSSEQGVLDPASVTLSFTPAVGASAQTFRRVETAEACGTTDGGFYYDDPSNPQRILLCPTTCDSVKIAGRGAKVDIELGCIRRVQ